MQFHSVQYSGIFWRIMHSMVLVYSVLFIASDRNDFHLTFRIYSKDEKYIPGNNFFFWKFRLYDIHLFGSIFSRSISTIYRCLRRMVSCRSGGGLWKIHKFFMSRLSAMTQLKKLPNKCIIYDNRRIMTGKQQIIQFFLDLQHVQHSCITS